MSWSKNEENKPWGKEARDLPQAPFSNSTSSANATYPSAVIPQYSGTLPTWSYTKSKPIFTSSSIYLTMKRGLKKNNLQRLQTVWRLIYQIPQRRNRHLGEPLHGWQGKELCHGESCKPRWPREPRLHSLQAHIAASSFLGCQVSLGTSRISHP